MSTRWDNFEHDHPDSGFWIGFALTLTLLWGITLAALTCGWG